MTFEIVTTRNCNLNCKYCFEGEKKDEFMDPKMIPAIFDFIKVQKNKDYVLDQENIHIDFNGVKHYLI